MRILAVLAIVGLAALAAPAWSQANIEPDPRPRLPPQPGQGLPFEDVEFLKTAAALGRIQMDYAALAGEKARSSHVREVANRIGVDNREALTGIERLAQARRVNLTDADSAVPDQGGPGGAASAVTNPRNAPGGQAATSLAELGKVSGERFDEGFLQAQFDVQKKLADLYQTQASQTTDRDLATFAITTLAKIQQQRQQLRQAARDYGIAVNRQGQPPQYGKADE